MKTYFDLSVIRTAEELKAAYRRQCLALHPDKGGDAEEFKAMQAEYIRAAQVLGLDTKENRQPLDEWAEILRQCKHTTRTASLRVGDFVHVFDMMEKSNDLRDAFRAYVRGTMEHHENAEDARKACATVGKIEAIIEMTDEEADAFAWSDEKPAGAGRGGSWGPIEDRQPRGMWDEDSDHQHYYYMITLIKTPSRYFFIDCEGYEYARCIMVPEFFEEFPEFIEERDKYEAEKRAEEEARQKAEAERLAMESVEVEKWRHMLDTLQPLPDRDYRDAASCKAYQKAEAHNKTVLKRNIKTILAHYFPGVKFTITDTSKTWCERSRISWTDGPTVAEVENVAEISRFIAEYYESDPYTDYGEYHSVKAWQQWRELFGAWSDDRVEYERELSAEGEAQAARVIAEFFPELEGREDAESVVLDSDHRTRFCVFLGVYSDWSKDMTEAEKEAANAFDREHRDTREHIENYLRGYCYTGETNRASVFRCLVKYMPIATDKQHTTTERPQTEGAKGGEDMTEAEAVAAILAAEQAGTITRETVGDWFTFSGRGTFGLKKAFRALGGLWDKIEKVWRVPVCYYEQQPPFVTCEEPTTEEPTETETTEPQQEEATEPQTETTEAERDPLAEELAAILRRADEIRAQMAEREAKRKAEEERARREAEKAAAIAAAQEEAHRTAEARAEALAAWHEAERLAQEAAARLSAAGAALHEATEADEAAAARLSDLLGETDEPATPAEGVAGSEDATEANDTTDTTEADKLRDFFERAAKKSDELEDWNDHTGAIYELLLAFLTASKKYTFEINNLCNALNEIKAAHEQRGRILSAEIERRTCCAYRCAFLCREEFGEELARVLFGSWLDGLTRHPEAATAA